MGKDEILAETSSPMNISASCLCNIIGPEDNKIAFDPMMLANIWENIRQV